MYKFPIPTLKPAKFTWKFPILASSMDLFHKISQLAELWFRKNVLIQPQSFHSIHLLIAITHQWTISNCFFIPKNYWIQLYKSYTSHLSLQTKELAGCPFTNSFAVKFFMHLNCKWRPSHSSWFEHILLFIKLCCTSWDPAHQTKKNRCKFHYSIKEDDRLTSSNALL